MTYLVTGATGFIGSKLVRKLLSRGDAVYYLARRRSNHLPSQASFHPWDYSLPPELNALSRIDAVFHLAGEPIAQRWSPEVKKRIARSRIEGTRNLVAALAKLRYKPSVLVSASAIGYYGDRGSEILTEASGPGEGFLADVCEGWEREAAHALELGVRSVSIRIATVLGRNGGALKEMLRPFRLGLGAKFGSGKQWMSWIQVDDLVRLFVFAADHTSIQSVLNGSSPQPVTNAEFTKKLAHVLHRPALFSMPESVMKMVLGEMAGFLFASARVMPTVADRAGFEFEHPLLESALRFSLS